MNLKDLEYFYQLARLKSYTEAARYFNVSQPTISYAIKRLENKLNCELVVKDPHHRSVVITLQGDIFLRHVEKILLEVRLSKAEIKNSLVNQPIIGFPPIISHFLIQQMLNKNLDLSFLSTLKTIRGGSNTLLMQLLDGQLDFSLLGSIHPLQSNELTIETLYKDPFFFVLSKTHPLANRKQLSFQDILSEQFILLDEHNIHLTAFEQLNQRYDTQITKQFKVDDIALIKQMIAQNRGISFLSHIAMINNSDNLITIPLPPDEQIYFYISYAYPKQATLSNEITQFIDQLKKLNL